jgi:tagatose-1,6-bisphosphate aldolase
MRTISIGKMRGLQQITSARGTLTVLALDHRQNLRKANPSFTDDKLLSAFKLDVVSALSECYTGVLLDPEVSAAQSISESKLPGNAGMVVALESTGYTGKPTARQSQIIPGWSVEKAKRMGANAVKLLVYYHPKADIAVEIEDFVSQVAEECLKYDLPLMLEPLSYSLNDASLSSAEKHEIVVETARRLSPLNIDLLKSEFPLDKSEKDEVLWKSACREISAACVTPWILLSAAVDFETYLQQVITACEAGASGIAVGRAVWQEAVNLQGNQRLDFLQTTARQRLIRLSSICLALGKPFTDFYHTSADFDWYKTY